MTLRRRATPAHPGQVLVRDFLVPHGLTQYRLAKGLAVPARRINEIVHGTRSVSADTALRLERFFGVPAAFWLDLQAAHDLAAARARLGSRLAREVTVLGATE